MRRLVLTGAAGRLGSYLREPLAGLAGALVSSDIADGIGRLYDGESYVRADLSDRSAVDALIEGAEMVVHFGAIPDEAPFDDILQSNIVGAYNVWRAAEKHGVRRVIYASSIHAVGMHPSRDMIGVEAAHRPDSFYGLSKCFAEDLARMYWDKCGIEAVCLRIASCAQVTSPRALGTWLSYGDLVRLVRAAITARVTEFSVIYGISANDRAPLDNAAAAHLGFRPQDNAEQFAETILKDAPPADPQDPGQRLLGGPFASIGLGESGLAQMDIRDDRKKT